MDHMNVDGAWLIGIQFVGKMKDERFQVRTACQYRFPENIHGGFCDEGGQLIPRGSQRARPREEYTIISCIVS